MNGNNPENETSLFFAIGSPLTEIEPSSRARRPPLASRAIKINAAGNSLPFMDGSPADLRFSDRRSLRNQPGRAFRSHRQSELPSARRTPGRTGHPAMLCNSIAAAKLDLCVSWSILHFWLSAFQAFAFRPALTQHAYHITGMWKTTRAKLVIKKHHCRRFGDLSKWSCTANFDGRTR